MTDSLNLPEMRTCWQAQTDIPKTRKSRSGVKKVPALACAYHLQVHSLLVFGLGRQWLIFD